LEIQGMTDNYITYPCRCV